MGRYTKYTGKWQGYFLDDCGCPLCLHYDKKSGCKLATCCCEDEKRDAIANGRIERERGKTSWDG